MSAPIQSVCLSDGITFTTIQDRRFKTNRLSIHLIDRLSEEHVTANALIPEILRDGFEGCENFTELNRRLETLFGARVETEVQKRGDSQVLSLSITGIDDAVIRNTGLVPEDFTISREMAEILCGILLHPVWEGDGFRTRYVELEKAAQADAIDAQINEKRSYAINRLIAVMCAKEPFGIPKYGRKEALAALTPQSLRKRYEELLAGARIEILFTGRGDAGEAAEVLRTAFAAVPRRYLAKEVTAAHPVLRDVPAEEVERLSVNQSKLVLGFGGGTSPTDSRVPAMRMMTAVLGGTPSSKLFLNVREKLSLCYYCAARFDVYKGIVLIDSGVEKDNISRAKEEILAQLDAVRRGDMTADEITAARLSLQNAYATIGESDSAIESFYLGQLLTGQGLTPEEESRRLETVTREEIMEAAAQLRLEAVYTLTGKEKE